jgi:hypothetical protein
MAVTDEQARPVGALLEGILQGFGIADKVRDAEALLAWDEVAGPTGVWRTHLSFSKQQLLQRLNAQLGRKVIKDLVFVNASANDGRG